MKRLSRWLLLAGFALTIFSGKLWLIGVAGSDLPTMDQWDGEAESVLRPWLEGHLTAANIFAPHNEHRIVLTKLTSLGLFLANGQWDALVEVTVNALLHLLSALALLVIARRWLEGKWLVAFGALLLLLFTLPFSWENSLNGFQNQFYFLLLFSLGQIALTLDSDRFTGRWWIGQLCAVLALASMATGFVASLAVLGVLGLARLARARWSAQEKVTAGFALGCVIVGWMLRTTVPGHEVLKAHSLAAFLGAWLKLLSWPVSSLLPLVIAPAAIFAVRLIRRRALTPNDSLLLGLLAWNVAQCAAIAYGRGGGDAVLSSRYLDVLAVNVALNFLLLLRALRGRWRWAGVTLWSAFVVVGLIQESRRHWRDYIAPSPGYHRTQQANVREFLRTQNPAVLAGKTYPDLPYPAPSVLQQRLEQPALQQILPPSVRRPIAVGGHEADAPPPIPPQLTAPLSPIAFSSYSAPTDRTIHWRSAPQSETTSAILTFRVAGDLGAVSHPLHLRLTNGTDEREIVPQSPPGNHWKKVSVFRPQGVWYIEAEDADPAGWFAFTDPVEIGPVRWVSDILVQHHFMILGAGVALLGLGAILSRRRPQPADPAASTEFLPR